MYECNPTATFDDRNLPDGLCDDMIDQIFPCAANIASGWAIGGNEVSAVWEIWQRRMHGEFIRRLWNFPKLPVTQLAAISKSNITWFKCTMIIHGECQVKYLRWPIGDSLTPDTLDRTDSSGIRFYLGKQRRQHELGYLSLGAEANQLGIAVPPLMDRFTIDSYCSATGTRVRIWFGNLPHSIFPIL